MPKNDEKKPADLGSEASSWENLEASSDVISWNHDLEIREQNKTMRRVYEENGMVYGRDVTEGEELRKRTRIALELRRKQVQGVVQKMSAARHLDLCFLVDVTGSMRKHIDSVKKHIRAIVEMLTNDDAESKKVAGTSSIAKTIRLAFVGYRDFNISIQFEVLDFTESVDTFHTFCGSITAQNCTSSGLDDAEDVFGGLEKANGLSWSTDGSTRMLFHIADFPCHGKEFHDLDDTKYVDNHPNGDPLGRSLQSLLDQLANKGIFYHFGKITKFTNKMVDKFMAAYDGEFIVWDVMNPDFLLDIVISSASLSLSKVAASGSRRAKIQFDKTEPSWVEFPVLNCLLLNFVFPTTIWEVLGAPEKKQPLKANIQIAGKPFAAGAERLAFYGRDVTDPSNPVEIVLKKFFDPRHQSYIHYEASMQRQNVAAFLASQFTAELQEKLAQGCSIKFLKTQLLSYHADAASGRRVYMSCEKRYPTGVPYLRFTNNMNYAMLELTAKLKGIDMVIVKQLCAFSHWTYQYTRGYLMVVDLQGIISTARVDDRQKQTIELTDPAIHCTKQIHFGRTNMGPEGMRAFFSNHQCNDICAKMGLTVPERFRTNPKKDDKDEE